ncbi:MAG: hypothetical protein ACP5XB_31250 [Isosphaeraceae bacterium]
MTSFQVFLRQKVDISALKDRYRSRGEWLGAINRLLDRGRGWLREADPDDLLEIVPYEVERVEKRLGIYDAPALKIRLGTSSVDVLPVGRYSVGLLSLDLLKGVPGNAQRWGDLFSGRVDITNGERRHILLRSIEDGQDRWYAVGDSPSPALLDRGRLEEILQELQQFPASWRSLVAVSPL